MTTPDGIPVDVQPAPHVHNVPMSVTSCTVYELAAIGALAMHMLPPNARLMMRLTMNEEAAALIDEAERGMHERFDDAVRLLNKGGDPWTL